MTLNHFNKFIDILKRKIYLLIGRAILTAIDNSGKTMRVQVTALKDETISDIERFEEYGFASYPKIGSAECVIGFINGNRDQGIVLCIHDREYRPKDLVEGESRLYNYDGKARVSAKAGLIEITGGGSLEFATLASKLKTQIDALIDTYNIHVHVDPQGGSTAVPTQQMVKPAQADYSSTEVKVS